MKKLPGIAFVLLVTIGFAQEHKSHEGKETSVTGEVIDMYCYLGHGSKGESHKACAEMCAKGGLPLGLLDDKGNVYIIITSDHSNANDKLMKYAAQKVTVKGTEVKRGGVTAIEMKEVMAIK